MFLPLKQVCRLTQFPSFSGEFVNRTILQLRFYGHAGLDIGAEEETPLDNFLENEVFKKVNQKHLTGLPKDVMQAKEYNELRMGGSRKNHKLEQFLQNDRKVCKS